MDRTQQRSASFSAFRHLIVPILCLWLYFSLSIQCSAQGTVRFDNRNLIGPAGVYDAPVTLPDGTRVRGTAFTAGLFVVESTGSRLAATTTFRDSPNGLGLLIPSIATLPGVPAGSPATLRIRVWETSAGSYNSAIVEGKYYGEFATGQPDNTLFIPNVGPPPGGPLVDPDLSGIQPLTLVPEPAAGALLALAGVIWLGAKGSNYKRVTL